MWRRREADGVEVLLVHRPHYDDWTFPKGKRDEGETDEQAAVREVEEETSLRCVLGPELPEVHYIDRNGRPKVVRYWVMEPEDVMLMSRSQPDAASCSATSTANGAPTAQPTTPISVPSTSAVQRVVW